MSSAVFGLFSGSCSLVVTFRGRSAKDAGLLTSMSSAFPGCSLNDLTIVVSDAMGAPLLQDDIKNAIILHIMNSNVKDTWSPPNGMTLSGVLQKELTPFFSEPLLSGSTRYLKCIFNGQFGPFQLAAV